MHGTEPEHVRNLVAESNTGWVRRNGLLWESVEAVPGARNWDISLEKELAWYAQNGIEVILIVRSTPEWAREVAEASCGPIGQNHLPAFAEFLFDAVARYSVPPYSVKYWEIWNEPDVVVNSSVNPFGCWGKSDDPTYGGVYYGEMLKVVYPQLKAANPEVQLLVGGLLLDCDPHLPDVCTNDIPPRFLQGILQSGAGNSFDGVSFHAYDYYSGSLGQYGNGKWGSQWNTTGPVVLAKLNYIKSLLDEYGVPNKYLINSESALLSYSGECDEICELSKAYYAAQVFTLTKAMNMPASIWFSITGWRASGLVGPGPEHLPLPIYQAYTFASLQLENTTFQQEITTYPGVKVFELVDGEETLWVLWSQDGGQKTIQLEKMPSGSWDALGTVEPVNGTELQVTVKPVFLRWNH